MFFCLLLSVRLVKMKGVAVCQPCVEDKINMKQAAEGREIDRELCKRTVEWHLELNVFLLTRLQQYLNMILFFIRVPTH